MARWRLRQKHYLPVVKDMYGDLPEWEYKEVNDLGRAKRIHFRVPLFLDPENPDDLNSPDGIIVAWEEGAHEKDYIFIGDPTPDMEPVDAEAEEISNRLSAKWKHPINDLGDEGGFAGQLVTELMSQMQSIAATAKPSTPVPGPTLEDYEALKAQVIALTEAAALKDEPARRRL